MNTPVSISDLKPGEKGVVAAINGGLELVRKLNAIGIYEGKELTKVSARSMHGPVVVRIGCTDLALGYGMAHRIMVLRNLGIAA